jgi:Fic family protein
MNTLKNFLGGIKELPAGITWYLADIAESKGEQYLYTHQSPQKLKILRDHALIESAVSSNRIEGVEIEKNRIEAVILSRPLLRDRNEEEVYGYRNVLQLIHENAAAITFSQTTVKRFHRMIRGDIWDAGKYKDKNSDIIERLPDGNVRVRFKTVPVTETSSAMRDLFSYGGQLIRDEILHPLIVIAAVNLDFLCIHPFRDGNGRVSRLLLLLQLYQAGYEVGRYISIERLIEEHKERYYETLELSSRRWHSGKHDPWPYVNFLLYILKKAYTELKERVNKLEIPKGGKTELVISAIDTFKSDFTLSQLRSKCPEVSRDMIRKVMKDLQKDGKIESTGRGPGARWLKKG